MTQLGTYIEPGIVTEVTSALGQPTTGGAPNDLCLVGQADLGDEDQKGEADPNTAYVVESARAARRWFGSETTSMLTKACLDALNEGAFPVYAIAAESSTESVTVDSLVEDAENEDVFLPNAPVREDPSSFNFTVDTNSIDESSLPDGTTTDDIKQQYEGSEPTIVYGDPDETSTTSMVVNPVTGEIPGKPGDEPSYANAITIEYETFDYDSAIETVKGSISQYVDFLVPLTENSDVLNKANTVVNSSQMLDGYNLMVMLGGAGINIDPTSWENPFDSSRVQVVYGTRFEEGEETFAPSLVAAYAGKRASLGIRTTPVKQGLTTNRRIHPSQAEDLTKAKRGQLIDKDAVPLRDEVSGPRIMDDKTTVTPDNSDEFNIDFGFERLVLDYVIITTRENERPFIGRLNKPSVRNTLEGMINQQLKSIEQSDVINDYNVSVRPGADSTTAVAKVMIDTAEPLRFIRNDVTVGQIA